jgi:hypothetical protein
MVRIHSPRPFNALELLLDTAAGANGVSAAFSSLWRKTRLPSPPAPLPRARLRLAGGRTGGGAKVAVSSQAG